MGQQIKGNQIGDGEITTAQIEPQEAWIAPSFTSGWVNYGSGYAAAGYYKDSLGIVHLKGLIKSGTVNSTAFTLPAGYRPSEKLITAAVSNNSAGSVRIYETGAVVPYTPSSSTWVDLSSVHFRAEQ